jgi:hypothetical protein
VAPSTDRSDGRRSLWRSRWAAIGAAVAVTLGGGGLFAVQAASSVPSSVVTIDPVRILDTRTAVGLTGPFASLTPRKLQVTGSAVPAGATGVLLNVTVVTPSADGFLSVRPGDATGLPSTSSLNFKAGEIVPNAVQVGLPTSGTNAGQIDITYDAFGRVGPTTDVLVDVVGYLGSNVVTDVEVVSQSQTVNLNNGDNTGFEAACPPGKKVTGGGISISDNDGLAIRRTIPNTTLSSWIGAVTGTKNGASGTVTVYAICASGVVLAP